MSRKLPLSAVVVLLIALAPAALLAQAEYASPEVEAKVKDALSATTEEIAAGATVVDWSEEVLKEGDNGWTCLPTPPTLDGPAPMCLDGPWLAWAEAWQTKQPVTLEGVGIAYMLAGDGGASNTDPFAEGPTETNEWVVAGPHLMVIVPTAADLESMPTDPENGGPWVMWKGTPYAHIMVPTR